MHGSLGVFGPSLCVFLVTPTHAVLRVPPQELHCMTVSYADDSCFPVEVKRVHLVNIVLPNFQEPPLGILRKATDRNCMMVGSLDPTPFHRIEISQPLDDLEFDVFPDRPGKRASLINDRESP